jgi:hypothetical protein
VRPIPKTYISLHDVSDLRAYVSPSPGSALELSIETPEGSVMIMLFLRSPDQAEALEAAINTVMAEPTPPAAACPIENAVYEAAAEHYNAQADYWSSLKRDLDRGWDSDRNKTYSETPSREDGKR